MPLGKAFTEFLHLYLIDRWESLTIVALCNYWPNRSLKAVSRSRYLNKKWV